MAYYYLAPYIGVGSLTNPFRPLGSNTPGWGAIDLRPRGDQVNGDAIVSRPIPVSPSPQLVDLGGSLDSPLPSLAKATIENRLGVVLTETTLRSVVAELLTVHGRLDGSRWKPLQPLGGTNRIHLGSEIIWNQPVISGGASFTESFNQADSTTLGPDLTWTETNGDLQTVGNRCRAVSIGVEDDARAESVLSSTNTYTEVNVMTHTAPASGTNYIGPATRFAAAARTYYTALALRTAAGAYNMEVYKYVAGASTLLSGPTDIAPFASGDTIQIRADGSTISSRKNGTEITTTTDSEITGGTRGGIFILTDAAASTELDVFLTSDIAAAAAQPLRKFYRGHYVGVWQGIG